MRDDELEVEQDAAEAQADDAEDEEDEEDEARDPGSPRHRPGLERSLAADPARLPSVLESLIFVADKPVTPVRLARLSRADLGDVRRALAQLVDRYAGRGIELAELGGGYLFRSAASNAAFVREFIQQKPVRLTRAQLETLSIVAYRQPATRPEIDDIRGVDSGSALKVLLERGLIKILGKKDEPGRPLLYGTSSDFLELFGLKGLRDLPTLREFAELNEESQAMFERKTGEQAAGIAALRESAGARVEEVADDADEDASGGSPEEAADDPAGEEL